MKKTIFSFAILLGIWATQAAALGTSDPVSPMGRWWQFIPLGFAVGILHALEADHLAAVATMFRSSAERRHAITRGAFWGLGHTASLFVICLVVMLLGMTISHRVEASLEAFVGVIIVLLGAQLIYRLYREKAHIHVHDHGGEKHLHFHTHKTAAHGTEGAHQHRHRRMSFRPSNINFKAMGIGLVHGAAGSAGLLVVLVASTQTLPQAMIYLALFGAGSIAGMIMMSLVISLPLSFVERGAKSLHNLAAGGIGLGAIWIGGALFVQSMQSVALTAG